MIINKALIISNMWFVFSLTAGLLFTVSALINRYLLKGDKDSWSYSFWFSFIAALITLPFMLANFDSVNRPITWGYLILIGILITTHNYLNFSATRYISPTIQNALNKVRIVWIFVFGLVLFGENLNLLLIIGVGLIISASLLVITNFREKKEGKGIFLSLIATLGYACVISLYNEVLKETNAFNLTFFIFLFPAIFNFLIIPNKRERLPKMFKMNIKLMLLAITASAMANLFVNYALTIGKQGQIITVTETVNLLLILGESLILKERKKIVIKSLALILAVIGAVLVILH